MFLRIKINIMEVDNEVMNPRRSVVDLRTNKNKRKRLFIPFNFYGEGLKLSLIAGVGMAIYLFALQLNSIESIGAKFFKYLVLGSILAYGLSAQKKFLGERYKYKRGILYGLFITSLSALILAGMNVAAYVLTETMSFSKFFMEADSVAHLAVISGVIFFEALVYGMILTFIILQYLKTSKKPI